MTATSVKMHIEGADTAQRVLRHLQFAARRRVVTAATRAGCKEIVLIARRMAPVRTGMMKRQISTSVKFDRIRGKVAGTVRVKRTRAMKRDDKRAAARYVHLVVGGARAHEIPRADAPEHVALRTQHGFFTRVQHPGMKPRPFMDQAANVGWRAAVAAFSAKFDEALLKEEAKAKVTA
jgi:hypothetical protein